MFNVLKTTLMYAVDTEEELQTANQQLHAIFDALGEGVCLLDSDGKTLCCNMAMLNLLKRSPNEILGRSWSELMLSLSDGTQQAFFTRLGETLQREVLDLDTGGQWLHITLDPVLNERHLFVGAVAVLSNITERKQAEIKLQDLEEQYRLLFESSPHPMWVYETETSAFLAVNDAAVEHYGYSRDEFLQMTIKDIRLSEDIGLLPRKKSPKPTNYGYWKHRKKDGTIINVETIGSEVPFRGRRAKLVLANDITERRRSEKLYGLLVDAIPSSALLIDQDMRVVLANKNFLEKARRSKADTIGKQFTEVFPKAILDDMEIDQCIQQVFHERKATEGKRLAYRAPGVPMRIYYYSVIPVTWGAEVQNVMLLMHDVTEQMRLSEEIRRVERHLAGVVESASDIVLSTDTEGKVSTWNRAAEIISGYSLDEVKEHFLFEHCSNDHKEKMEIFFSRMEIQKKSPNMVEWDLVTKQGALIPVSWVFSPMKDDLDQIVGIVAVGRDLTERRKFEMQILQSQKLAALGVMAGGIAHEIRNPLAIASSAAQFLMEENVTPEFGKECAEKIHAGLHRASIIIENLLKVARPSARADLERVDLIFVLKEVMTLIESQARLQKIKINSNLPIEPIIILGIVSLLEQVFMNLLLNAINAMPAGGALSISVQKTDNEVLVRVADTGHGISSTDIGNIFDPFYTTSPVGKGSGLGLSICYSIIKQHFGSIEVESVREKGSTFTVKFPPSTLL